MTTMPRPARARMNQNPDGRMTLAQHLIELRRRLFISVIAVIVFAIAAFVFHTEVLHVLTRPYCDLKGPRYHLVPGKCDLIATGPLEPFTIVLKLSLYTGIIASSPVWLYQMWRFITPGLYRHERRNAFNFVAASIGLFCLGGFFAWLTLEKGLRFLLGFATGGIQPLLAFNSYLSFVTAMILIFAVSFEFPLLVVMLNRVNVVSAAKLKSWSRGIVFGIFVFAAVGTPSQDPFTMLALAVPMTVLYGVAYLIAKQHDKRRAKLEGESLFEPVTEAEMAALDGDGDDEDEAVSSR